MSSTTATSVPTPEDLDELRTALTSIAILNDPAQQQVCYLTIFFREQPYPTPCERALGVPVILGKLVNEGLISKDVMQVFLEQENAIVARLQDEEEDTNDENTEPDCCDICGTDMALVELLIICNSCGRECYCLDCEHRLPRCEWNLCRTCL